MSNDINQALLERAGEMKSVYEGTDLELAINKAIADNDLERLEYIVTLAEDETSRQDYYNNDTY